jgi:hypothetical protein
LAEPDLRVREGPVQAAVVLVLVLVLAAP